MYLARAVARHGVEVGAIDLPRSRHILAGDMRLHCLTWGAATNPALVLLHGAGLNAHTFDLVAVALCDRVHVIAVDLRGHGDSEWSRSLNYSVGAHAADVRALLHALDATPAVVVGMSLGGIVGMELALSWPTIVRGLVLIDVGPPPRDAAVDRVDAPMQREDTFTSVEDAVEQLLRAKPLRDPDELRWSVRQNLMRMHGGGYTWKFDRRHRSTRDHVDEVLADNRRLAAHIGDLACPLLVVKGGASDMLHRSAVDAFVARARTGRAVEIPGARHAVQASKPAALVAELESFIAGLPPATTGS